MFPGQCRKGLDRSPGQRRLECVFDLCWLNTLNVTWPSSAIHAEVRHRLYLGELLALFLSLSLLPTIRGFFFALFALRTLRAWAGCLVRSCQRLPGYRGPTSRTKGLLIKSLGVVRGGKTARTCKENGDIRRRDGKWRRG